MAPAPASTPLPPTFPDRDAGLAPASSSHVRRKSRHHQETQGLPFLKQMHSHRGREHGLANPEQLQTAGILWVSGIYFTPFCPQFHCALLSAKLFRVGGHDLRCFLLWASRELCEAGVSLFYSEGQHGAGLVPGTLLWP